MVRVGGFGEWKGERCAALDMDIGVNKATGFYIPALWVCSLIFILELGK